MDLRDRRSRVPPPPRSEWDWDREIAAAITMVARNRDCRVVLCGDAATGRVIAKLAGMAAGAGVVLEPRIRRGGGWDVEVRAA
jgi:predicted urease superfamily metal-dependent hydrolase